MSKYDHWLAAYADALTPDEVERFDRAADAYYAQPHVAQRDPADRVADAAEDDAALTAILQTILEEGTLETIAREARQSQAALTGWIRGTAALGESEVSIAERSQLARVTVRKRIGK